MRKVSLLFFVMVCAFAFSAWGADAPAAGFRSDFAIQMDETSKKLVDLAEAIPADKFGWRPAEGVRSVSEVFVHVVGGNYYLLKFAGVEPPMPLDQDMEKTMTDKAKIIEMMKQSVEHAKQAMAKATDADLDKAVEFFGQKTTVHNLYFIVAMHNAEHLGQAIAYARMNGITPPWSK